MKQKLLTDIELDVHELKYLMDSFTKEPTPTLSELLKRSITRMQGRLEELQQEVDAVQVISPSAVEETAEEEDEVAGSEEDSPVIIQSLESVVVKEDEEGEAIVAEEEDNYVVTQIEDGEWMNYTVSIPTDGDYTVYLVYQSKGNSLLSVASDSEVKTEPMQLPSSVQWTEREIGKLTLPAGACVLRLQIEQAGDKLEIQKIIVK